LPDGTTVDVPVEPSGFVVDAPWGWVDVVPVPTVEVVTAGVVVDVVELVEVVDDVVDDEVVVGGDITVKGH
jgi:hypothetical protein